MEQILRVVLDKAGSLIDDSPSSSTVHPRVRTQ